MMQELMITGLNNSVINDELFSINSLSSFLASTCLLLSQLFEYTEKMKKFNEEKHLCRRRKHNSKWQDRKADFSTIQSNLLKEFSHQAVKIKL